MELRKVQLTGGSSLTVTLPKGWVEKAQVKAGDVVGFMERPDGSLTVQPHARAEREIQKYTIEIEEGEASYLFRKIIGAYLMGYDAIMVKSKRPLSAQSRAAVRKAVGRIIGLEVVEEEANAITIQDFLDPREFHLDKALRRMEMLTRAMQEEAVAVLRTPSPDALRSVQDRDDEVDRLYWLVNKQFHAILRDASYAARMELTASEALNFLLVARLVERTADHAARIVAQGVEVPHGKAPDAFLVKVEKQLRVANDLFRGALLAFHARDARKADAIIEEATQFKETHEKVLREGLGLGSEAVSHVAFILESVGRTAAYAADVGELAINHRVAAPSA